MEVVSQKIFKPSNMPLCLQKYQQSFYELPFYATFVDLLVFFGRE